MATALVSLGSNVGDRAAAIRTALELLGRSPGVRLTASSSLRETKPAGGPESQEEFLNAAALLETSLPPLEVLSVLQNIENHLGRIRIENWGPRTIDLDLLLYDQLELATPELTLPHPRMSFRRFVLEPAAEIAAEMVYPINGWMVGELRDNLDQSPKYLALGCTPYSVGPYRLRPALQETLDCAFIQEPDIQLSFVATRGISDPAEGASVVDAEHMARMARLLNAALASAAGRWLISDFWFDSHARSFEMTPDESQRQRLWDEWSRLRRTVPLPRLVILFESDQRLWDLMFEQSQNDEVLRQSLGRFNEGRRIQLQAEAAIKAISRRRDVGPTMWLPASDQDRCIAEVLAAIAAME
jgi:2-amino-4-hydroxy-6-hydroxymethyldihydropteridine diphosphokinase